MPARLLSCLVFGSLIVTAAAIAEPNPVQRTTVQQQAYPSPGYKTVQMKITVDAGAATQPHTHPGVEMGYIADGSASLFIRGRPAKPLRTGDMFSVPADVVHYVTNTGPGTLTVISTY